MILSFTQALLIFSVCHGPTGVYFYLLEENVFFSPSNPFLELRAAFSLSANWITFIKPQTLHKVTLLRVGISVGCAG